jgi:hypothetical protein
LNSNAINATDGNSLKKESALSRKIPVIMRGITRFLIVAVAGFEHDKNRTGNNPPPI